MTKSVSFKTARGAEISITIVTERGKVADASMIESCWTLQYSVNGKTTFGERIEHPETGAAIKLAMGTRWEGKKMIAQEAIAPIPADKLAEVDALLSEFVAGVKERSDAITASEMSPSVQFSRRLTADMDRSDSDN